MERNWKGKLSKSKTRERIGKLSNYFREERKGLLSKIIGQMTMYELPDEGRENSSVKDSSRRCEYFLIKDNKGTS